MPNRKGLATLPLPRLLQVRRIVIVGSTGSIGTQALDVVEASPALEGIGLAADSSWEPLLEQARRHAVGRVALANKESLVVAGELATALAEATGAQIIPVDSEHSALYQLIRLEPPGTVE